MATINAIIPAEVDLTSLPTRKVGELLIHPATASLYMVVLQDNQKTVVPIRGEANYKLVQYLKYNNLIQSVEPEHPEWASTWYNTDLTYTQPNANDTKSAFISIKVADQNNSKGFRWLKILPITEASNVYIGKDEATGRVVTLYDLIDRQSNKFSIDVNTNSFYPVGTTGTDAINWRKENDKELRVVPREGNISIDKTGGNFSLKLQIGPNPDDIITIADNAISSTIDILEEANKVGNKPRNFNENTVWYKEYNPGEPIDNFLENSRTLFLNTVKGNSTDFGLKFVPYGNRTEGISITGNGKVVRFNSRATNREALVRLKLKAETGLADEYTGFDINRTTYFELHVDNDNDDVLEFTLYNDNFTPSESNGIDLNAIRFISNGYYHNSTVPTPYLKNIDTFKHRTLFFMINKGANNNAKIAFGHIVDSGEYPNVRKHEFLVGSNNLYDMSNWLYIENLNNLVIGATTPADANTLTQPVSSVVIKKLSMIKLDSRLTPINNELPDENVFEHTVLATNAKSVYLDNGKTLHEIMAGGRLITTLRTYQDTNNGATAKVGELLVENLANGEFRLRVVREDGNSVPVAGKYERAFLDHLRSSVRYKDAVEGVDFDINTLPIEEFDKSIMYFTPEFTTVVANKEKILKGNPVILIPTRTGTNVETGEPIYSYEYKMIIPSTVSKQVFHKPTNGTSTRLDKYIDKIDDELKALYNDNSVYHDINDIARLEGDNKSYSELIHDNIVGTLALKHLLDNMKDNSVLNVSLGDPKLPTAQLSPESIVFKDVIPYEGSAKITKNKYNNSLTLEVVTTDGKTYKSTAKLGGDGTVNVAGYKLSDGKNISDNGKTSDTTDNVTVNESLVVNGTSTLKDTVTAKDIILTGDGDTRGISTNLEESEYHLIRLSGEKNNPKGDNTTTNIGDDNVKYLTLHSLEKPTWLDPTTNRTYEMVTQDNLDGFFAHKGSLKTKISNRPKDLNTIKGVGSTGYYTYAHNTDNNIETSNFPATEMKPGNFVLFVIGENGPKYKGNWFADKLGMQILYHYERLEDDKYDTHIYTRVLLENEEYSDWKKIASEDDLNTKIDISGGEFTGDVTFKDSSLKLMKSVQGGANIFYSLNSTTAELPNLYIRTDANNTYKAISHDNNSLILGDSTDGNIKTDKIVMHSIKRPAHYVSATKTEDLAYKSEVNEIDNRLNSYVTKKDLSSLLSDTATNEDIATQLEKVMKVNKYNKIKEATGAIVGMTDPNDNDKTTGVPNYVINNTGITMGANGKLVLGGNLYNTPLAYTTFKNATYTEATNQNISFNKIIENTDYTGFKYALNIKNPLGSMGLKIADSTSLRADKPVLTIETPSMGDVALVDSRNLVTDTDSISKDADKSKLIPSFSTFEDVINSLPSNIHRDKVTPDILWTYFVGLLDFNTESTNQVLFKTMIQNADVNEENTIDKDYKLTYLQMYKNALNNTILPAGIHYIEAKTINDVYAINAFVGNFIKDDINTDATKRQDYRYKYYPNVNTKGILTNPEIVKHGTKILNYNIRSMYLIVHPVEDNYKRKIEVIPYEYMPTDINTLDAVNNGNNVIEASTKYFTTSDIIKTNTGANTQYNIDSSAIKVGQVVPTKLTAYIYPRIKFNNIAQFTSQPLTGTDFHSIMNNPYSHVNVGGEAVEIAKTDNTYNNNLKSIITAINAFNTNGITNRHKTAMTTLDWHAEYMHLDTLDIKGSPLFNMEDIVEYGLTTSTHNIIEDTIGVFFPEDLPTENNKYAKFIIEPENPDEFDLTTSFSVSIYDKHRFKYRDNYNPKFANFEYSIFNFRGDIIQNNRGANDNEMTGLSGYNWMVYDEMAATGSSSNFYIQLHGARHSNDRRLNRILLYVQVSYNSSTGNANVNMHTYSYKIMMPQSVDLRRSKNRLRVKFAGFTENAR